MDYFVAKITQSRPSEYQGHLLLVSTNTCPCSYIATVHILAPFFFWGVGGPKSILFCLFWNKEASFKGIYKLNCVHMRVYFNTESLNATHCEGHSL